MTLTQISKEIHKSQQRIWFYKNTLNKERRYDAPLVLVKEKTKLKELLTKREEEKAKILYPRKPVASGIKTRIMKECIRKGWNAKEIAGYFKVTVQSIYYHIDIKSL